MNISRVLSTVFTGHLHIFWEFSLATLNGGQNQINAISSLIIACQKRFLSLFATSYERKKRSHRETQISLFLWTEMNRRPFTIHGTVPGNNLWYRYSLLGNFDAWQYCTVSLKMTDNDGCLMYSITDVL